MEQQCSDLTMLAYVMLRPSWIEHSPAMMHPDPRVFRWYMRILLHAWRSRPVGEISCGDEFFTEVLAVPKDDLAGVREALLHGFERDGQVLRHAEMFQMGEAMCTRYGPQLEDMASRASMACQDADLFGFAIEDTKAPGRAAAKRCMPKSFGFDAFPQLRDWCRSNGYPTDADQDWVMVKFHDYVAGKALKSADWLATFRTWATNEIVYGRRPPSASLQTQGRGASGGLATVARSQAAAQHNQEMLNRFQGGQR